MTEYTIPMIIVGAIFFGFIIILFVGTLYNFKPNKNIKQNTIKQSQETVEPYEHMPYYLMDSVMTYHETILFSILSDFCQKYKFVLLSKVRLADFIQPINTTNRKDYYHWFNRISARIAMSLSTTFTKVSNYPYYIFMKSEKSMCIKSLPKL